ncbi:GINS complex subunit 2 [Angomonas deanei]|nr:GINS complex subunit 2 [Angomonas deanei]|eukprot:EPY42271.1 GINS complex subunit 2 [Angomonas deanei]
MTSAVHDGPTEPRRVDLFNEYHFSSFAAQEVPITVIPRFAMEKVESMNGASYGPFSPNYPVEVPLWLALYVRQTDSCKVQLPSYLRKDYLQKVLERERSNERSFERLPFYFFEIAKCLLQSTSHASTSSAAEEGEVRRLVRDLQHIRQRKLQDSMAVLEGEGSPMTIPGIKLTNIISTELHYLRSTFAVVLTQAAAMDSIRHQTQRLPTVSTAAVSTPSTATRRTRDTFEATPDGGEEVGASPEVGPAPSVTDTMTTDTTLTAAQPPPKKRRTLRQ